MSNKFKSIAEHYNIKGKTALVRIGCDVPMQGKKIVDDSRLREILPTIRFLEKHGAYIILVGHLGRPGGKVVSSLSLKPIGYHLGKLLRQPVKVIPINYGYKKIISEAKSGVVLLENIRFEVGEDSNDNNLAKNLARLADFFVNEAFSVSHRESASLCGVAKYLPSFAGLTLYHEITTLKKFMSPRRKIKSVAIIGGAKVADKLPVIKSLLKKVDYVLTGGAVANTLLKAKGREVGVSLIDKDDLSIARVLVRGSARVLVLPKDVVVSKGARGLIKFATKLSVRDKIIDLGPLTTALYLKYLKTARIIFWAGSLGITEHKVGSQSTLAIGKFLSKMSHGSTQVLVGGGDTGSFLINQGLKVTHISTAGGALLEFLAGHKLPALMALGYYER